MKKILSVLLIVALLCSISVMLFACTNGELKKLTYTDENGQEQTITVKKTADADKVTASILALAGKEVDTTSYNNLVVSVGSKGTCSGSQKGAAFNMNFDVSGKVGIALPATVEEYTVANIVNASKVYVGVEFKGRLPKPVAEDEVPNFCDAVDLDENAKLYLDESKLYTQLNLSEAGIAAISADYGVLDFAAINGKTGKVDLSAIIGMVDALLTMNKVTSSDIAAGYKSIFNAKASYLNTVEKIANMGKDQPAEGEEAAAEPTVKFADVKKVVEACGIQITKVKGSKVTFSAKIDKTSMENIIRAFEEDQEKAQEAIADLEFDGAIELAVEIDAKTMVDISVSATITNGFAGLFEDIPASEEINLTNQELTITASISTKEAVPTISEEDKAAAVEAQLDLSPIIGKMMNK